MDKNKFQLNVEITSNQNESDSTFRPVVSYRCVKLLSFVIQAIKARNVFMQICVNCNLIRLVFKCLNVKKLDTHE